MKITAEMLPQEGGEVIRFIFSILFPEGATIEELKNSKHKTLRDIGIYFEEKALQEGGQE